jgi:DNA-binding transcriptional ArsR family regulator
MDVGRMAAHSEQMTPLLKALGHPARLLIALRLREGACAVSDLETGLGLRQPNLSQHLAALRVGGLVDVERRGRSATYRLAQAAVPLIDFLAGGRAAAARPLRASRRASVECGVFAVTED